MAWLMPDSETALSRRAMTRVPRWWLLLSCVALVVAGLVAAYWAGSAAAASAGPHYEPPAEIPVSATVQKRAVNQQAILTGRVVAGATSAVRASLPEGTDRLILTSTPKAAGDSVAPGELLAVVSGRPLLMIQASVPLYRDIKPGDAGMDVQALQRALAGLGLAVKISGIFDQPTQSALKTWYGNAGFEAPSPLEPVSAATNGGGKSSKASTVMFSWREFVQVPGDTGRIASMAAVGTLLPEDGVVAHIAIAEDTIVARANLLQAKDFAVGAPATVRAGSTSMDSAVAAVSAFVEGDESKNEVPGVDITLPIPAGAQGLSPEQSVTVTSGSVPPESLAVPLIAIRQENGIAYVQLSAPDGSRRIDVTVTAQADGWAAIDDGGGLAVGDSVLLP